MPEDVPQQPAADEQPAQKPAARATNTGRIWIAVGIATILLILLIIFIAENSADVKISFLGAGGKISLALALLISAVVGALVAVLVGTARILELRREVRRTRKAHLTHRMQPR